MAFPLISSGTYGYPKDQALKVAVDTISTFLLENEMMVYIVIFDKKAYQISGKLFADIAAYIDDRLSLIHIYFVRKKWRGNGNHKSSKTGLRLSEVRRRG